MTNLLDADVLITANNTYYPIDRVPEFWEWLKYQARCNRIKIPREMIEEILAGKEDDLLLQWFKEKGNRTLLELEASVDSTLVQIVVSTGYGDDLADYELEEVGRDPFLIAHALADHHCVVTVEASRPSKKRQNRKIPDICRDLGVECCGPFKIYKELDFRTGWKPESQNPA